MKFKCCDRFFTRISIKSKMLYWNSSVTDKLSSPSCTHVRSRFGKDQANCNGCLSYGERSSETIGDSRACFHNEAAETLFSCAGKFIIPDCPNRSGSSLSLPSLPDPILHYGFRASQPVSSTIEQMVHFVIVVDALVSTARRLVEQARDTRRGEQFPLIFPSRLESSRAVGASRVLCKSTPGPSKRAHADQRAANVRVTPIIVADFHEIHDEVV